jgi:hypothetical protein
MKRFSPGQISRLSTPPSSNPIETYVSYQLIRNVLAAYDLGLSFCVLLDSRRPDLIEACFAVNRCARLADLRTRCKVLIWLELAERLPDELQVFDRKYGIVSRPVA